MSAGPPLVGEIVYNRILRAAAVEALTLPIGATVCDRYTVSGSPLFGGMAEVYPVRDELLGGRPVALKLIGLRWSGDPEAERQFEAEATLTAGLQHTNIVPVHDRGRHLGRLFYVMKLASGERLGKVLAAHPRPDHAYLLRVFEAMCAAVGHAHKQGVVHRDLKPDNVLVSPAGVHVLDWGLARDVSGAAAGRVAGTPGYMPPEQANGIPADARADVFALGAILCEMLTGAPPRTNERHDPSDHLAEAVDRLEGSGANAEVVALAAWCLRREAVDRPADGGTVGDEVRRIAAAAEERARRADRRAVAARWQLILVAAMATVLLAAGLIAWRQERADSERRNQEAAERARLEGERDAEARNRVNQARQGVAFNLAHAVGLRKQYKFAEAGAALTQAAEQAKAAPELGPTVERARQDLEFVVQLDDIRFRKWAWVVGVNKRTRERMSGFNLRKARSEYREAFAAHDLDLQALSVGEATKQILASDVKVELIAAADDWALYEPDDKVRRHLTQITRAADPGAWTDRLRELIVTKDRVATERLVAGVDPVTLPSKMLSVLAMVMYRGGLDPTPLLSTARVRHSSDFELAYLLGFYDFATANNSSRRIGAYEAACALRPENAAVWLGLGLAYSDNGDAGRALAAYQKAVECKPNFALAHSAVACVLNSSGRVEEAVVRFRKAIELDPTSAYIYNDLGVALLSLDRADEAIVTFRQAIALSPDDADYHHNLGIAYRKCGKLDEAIASYRSALKLAPKDVALHGDLGTALQQKGNLIEAIALYQKAIELDQKFVLAHTNLGIALKSRGKLDEAIAAYRRAVELDPKRPAVHYNLGIALREKGDLIGAIAAYQKAVELNPNYASAYHNLGVALRAKGDTPGATAAFEKATRCEPRSAHAYIGLGEVYFEQGMHEKAIESARAATQLAPDSANAHALLGQLLLRTGDKFGARAALEKAAALNPKRWTPALEKLPPLEIAPAPRSKP